MPVLRAESCHRSATNRIFDSARAALVFGNEYYAFLWISALDYAAHARQRSPK